MTYRIAINGLGRIGQCTLRALYEEGKREHVQVVAINELSNLDTLAYLIRYDTTHGRFSLPVEIDGEHLRIGDDEIKIFSQQDPAALPWAELDIDMVLDCTGQAAQVDFPQKHIKAGAKRVLIAQPSCENIDATVVYGFNHQNIKASDRIVSNASCTSNAIVPILDLLHKAYGIERGMITTIHSAMNDQPVIDSYHSHNLRLARSAMHSIVPIDTSLARGVERLLPELKGRFDALHMRVPTINVSLLDITLNLSRDCDLDELNERLRAACSGPLQSLLGFTQEPLASVDFNHDSRSAIVDATQTRLGGRRMLKLVLWFDNEWAYSNRMLDVASYWLDQVDAQKNSDKQAPLSVSVEP